MLAQANTTVSILRGSTVDEFGDDEPGSAVAHEGVPASLYEKTRTVFDPDTSRPVIVRYTTVRLDGRADVQEGDRILDESTGYTYSMLAYSTPNRAAGFALDTRLDLMRVT